MASSFRQMLCTHDWIQAHVPSLHYRWGYKTFKCLRCGKELEFDPLVESYARQLGQKHAPEKSGFVFKRLPGFSTKASHLPGS